MFPSSPAAAEYVCVCLQLKMYPQLLWGAVSMLHTTYVPLFHLALRLLHSLLSSLQLWNLPCQQVLQAAAPTRPSGPGIDPPSGLTPRMHHPARTVLPHHYPSRPEVCTVADNQAAIYACSHSQHTRGTADSAAH